MCVRWHGCVERHGDVLVVYEGAARLEWTHTAAGFVLTGVGPDLEELAEIGVQVGRRLPLLVLLERTTLPVAVLDSELVDLPDGVRVVAAEDGVTDLEVAVLDWLPQPLHGRGLRFLADAARSEAATPAHRLPPVLVDEVGDSQAHVRFARLSVTCPSWTPALLESLLDELFAAPMLRVPVGA